MSYPREYLSFVERILREYPQNVEELKNLDETIEACCRAPSLPTMTSGQGSDTEPERVTMAKLENRHYQWLTGRINRIQTGMSTLTKQERDIAEILYWEDMRIREISEEMHLGERWIKRLRLRILHKLSKTFISMWVR
jgi:DNA-directed RNA polymerase specialized sigma subunit